MIQSMIQTLNSKYLNEMGLQFTPLFYQISRKSPQNAFSDLFPQINHVQINYESLALCQ